MASRTQKKKPQKTRSTSKNTVAFPLSRVDSSATNRWQAVFGKRRPRAGADELRCDVAVFDDDALHELPSPLREEVQAVQQALDWVASGHDELAKDAVSIISRRSEMSDWRLLVRGLIDWYANDFAQAQLAFEKLSPVRRPWRISRILTTAANWAPEAQTSAPIEPVIQNNDESFEILVEATWQVRFERNPLRIIDEILRRREQLPAQTNRRSPPEAALGLNQAIDCLELSKQIHWVEPQLAEAIVENLRSSVFSGGMNSMFEMVVGCTAGPYYDVNNNLTKFLFHTVSGERNEADRKKQSYIAELAKNNWATAGLRDAILAGLYLADAKIAVGEQVVPGSPFARFAIDKNSRIISSQQIRSLFEAATRACPRYRIAHEAYVDWLELVVDFASKAAEKREQRDHLAAAMTSYAAAFPEDPRPTLWLANHYLDAEIPESAAPYVNQLRNLRLTNLRFDALGWKQSLFNAMSAAGKKKTIEDGYKLLAEAEAIWPVWFDKSWAVFLHAALETRNGQPSGTAFATSEVSLQHVVALLAAYQRMRVPAKDQKPLRDRLAALLAIPSNLTTDDLLNTAKFFHHLQRVGITYPAHRLHAGKIEKELCQRIKKTSWLTLSKFGERLDEAIFWLAARGSLSEWKNTSASNKILQNASKRVRSVVKLLNGIRGWNRYYIDDIIGEIPMLENCLPSEQDPYLRLWFGEIVNQANEIIDSITRRSPFGPAAKRKGESTFDDGNFEDEDTESYFDEYEWNETEDETPCNCPKCTYARMQAMDLDDDGDADQQEFNGPETGSSGTWRIDPPAPSGFTPQANYASGEEIKKSRPKNPMGKKSKR